MLVLGEPNGSDDGGGNDNSCGETLPVSLPFLTCGRPAHLSHAAIIANIKRSIPLPQ